MHFLSAHREFARHLYCAETAQRGASYPALQGNAACGVAVVGGGLAALSATIALADKGFSVRLLEARQAGFDASGRTAGQATSAAKARALQAGADHLAQAYGYPMQPIAAADMPNWINSACCQAAVHDPRSGHLHPLKYAPGLARATAGLGLPLPKHTAASAFTPAASPTVTAGARPTSAARRTRRKSII